MSIRTRCIPLDHPDQWRQALTGVSHSFGHTWENCYAMSLTSGLPTYLYCFEDGPVRVVCPITERRHGDSLDIAKPFGFSGFVGTGESPVFSSHWKEFARQRGYVCGYLGLNPLQDYGGCFDPAEVFQYDTVHLLDLRREPQELWAGLSGNRRRQLKNWHEDTGNFVVDKAVLGDFFRANQREFFHSRGAERHYSFSEETLAFLFGLDNVLLVGAAGSDGIEAVSVFVHTADVGEYLFNISLPTGKEHSASLIWYGVHRLKSLQVPVLNLGGGQGGVGEFKRYFGGREVALRCVKQVYDRERYHELCRGVQADPDDCSGYFPAYRRPA